MKRIRRWALAASGVVVVGASVVVVAPSAGASGGTGTASGVVTAAATGKPLKGVCVNVVEASDNTTVGTSAPTAKNGQWSLAGIPPASDYTAIAGTCKSSYYVGQWWNTPDDMQPDAAQFAVTDGGTTSGLDFSLSLGGGIAGKVTDSVTNKPVAGILVVALWTTAFQSSTYAQCTSSNGKYKLKGVPTSGAKILFEANDCGVSSTYPTTFYDGASDYGSATVVPITAKKVTSGLDEVMTAGG